MLGEALRGLSFASHSLGLGTIPPGVPFLRPLPHPVPLLGNLPVLCCGPQRGPAPSVLRPMESRPPWHVLDPRLFAPCTRALVISSPSPHQERCLAWVFSVLCSAGAEPSLQEVSQSQGQQLWLRPGVPACRSVPPTWGHRPPDTHHLQQARLQGPQGPGWRPCSTIRFCWGRGPLVPTNSRSAVEKGPRVGSFPSRCEDLQWHPSQPRMRHSWLPRRRTALSRTSGIPSLAVWTLGREDSLFGA